MCDVKGAARSDKPSEKYDQLSSFSALWSILAAFISLSHYHICI